MSFPTPDQVEGAWLRAERALVNFMARSKLSVPAGVLGVLVMAGLAHAMIPYAFTPFRSFAHVEVS